MSSQHEQLPAYDRQHFPHNQLELAVAQVTFPSVGKFSDERALSGIKSELADEYPLIAPTSTMNLVVGPQGISQTPAGQSLRFTSLDHRWMVDLSDSGVFLETRQYEGIHDHVERFTDVLRVVAEHFQPRYQLRFGLRFVNEFRHDRGRDYQGWTTLLNPELLGVAARGILGGSVEQTVSETRTRRKDGTLQLRHGFLQGTTVMANDVRPAKSGPFYLLDLDYFDSAAKKFDAFGVAEQMERYDKVLYRVFRWAVGNGELYRSLLRGRP